MQRIFQNKSEIDDIKDYEDIEQINCHSDEEMLHYDTFLSTSDIITNNDAERHQFKSTLNNKNDEKEELIEADLIEKSGKSKKQKPNINSETRLSNYIFPNIIREVKQCLSNSFQAEKKSLYTLLTLIFKELKINYQVWAYDAIFVILIFLRDKTDLLTPKKFSAVIDHISSTLSKYLAKFVSKPFTKEQLQYLNNQYHHCIRHLKVYDDAENSFDTITSSKGRLIKEDFFACVLLTRRRQRFKFVESINDVEESLNKGLVIDLINKSSNEKKQVTTEKKEKNLYEMLEK